MSKEIILEDEVKKLAIAGANKEQICEDLVKRTGCDLGTIVQIFESIEAIFERRAKVDPEKEYGKSLMQLDMLFLACVRIQDFKTALSIRKEQNDLLNLKKHKPGAPAASAGKLGRWVG